MKFDAKTVLDIAVWGGATSVAMLGAASTQPWDKGHIVNNVGALLAILVAALKRLPDMPGETNANPN